MDTLDEAAIRPHFTAIGTDNLNAAEIYADDAVLEYVQSGERIRGRLNIIASRNAYPGRRAPFEVHRIFGIATAVAVEMTMHLEGDEAHPVVAILDLRDGLVTRERIYIADPWEPITYRRPWAEPLKP